MRKKKGVWINRHTFHEFKEKTKKGSLSREIATRDRSLDFFGTGNVFA